MKQFYTARVDATERGAACLRENDNGTIGFIGTIPRTVEISAELLFDLIAEVNAHRRDSQEKRAE